MAKQLPPSMIESSGYSASYLPENVRVNQPNEQASRWSSAANDQNQFLLLKLDKMALLEAVSFGKFHKVHVCNLKEFKVLAGPTLDSLQLILHSGLNNDTLPESFPPDYSLTASRLPFPVRFVKIVPVAAWGSNFNFSIWYIELKGWEDNSPSNNNNNNINNTTADNSDYASQLVKGTLADFQKTRQEETTRLILKFLRQNNHTEAFTALQVNSGISLEAPIVTQLHALLVGGKLQEVENLFLNLYTQTPGIFDEFLHERVPYEASWTRLSPSSPALDENGDYHMLSNGPSARGGHQLIWDPQSRRILLLGGWDGSQDLADLWMFDPAGDSWTLISANVEAEGGPSGRSCHKAVLHTSTRQLYILGRYLDPERRDPLNLPCDFYRFDLNSGQWTRISADVRAEGGPGCIYDHQMVLDEEEDCLWVFGGRLLGGTNEQSVYSGLYKHDLKTGQWTLVHSDLSDNNSNINDQIAPIRIPARIGHSMLFDPATRSLLILAGQRYKDQLADFYRFAVDRGTVTHMIKNLQMVSGPEPRYTQRASLDPSNHEMFVFSTLVRSSSSSSSSSSNTASSATNTVATNPTEDSHFWHLDLETDKWTRIATSTDSPNVPSARFAHQVVYDPTERTIYLFGGNPGLPNEPGARLNDLWKCQMRKSLNGPAILRHCQFLIRQAIFHQMLGSSLNNNNSNLAVPLQYLQKDLSSVVNHDDPVESLNFRSLSLKLFTFDANITDNNNNNENSVELFNSLVKFLPRAMQPPIYNL